MRIMMVVFAVFASVVSAFVVDGRARRGNLIANSQKEVIHLICPLKIEAGPAKVPKGWQSLGNLFYQRRSISVDDQQHLVVCWYGEGKPLPPYLIAQPIPAGYVCKVLQAEDTSQVSFEAECRPPRRRR